MSRCASVTLCLLILTTTLSLAPLAATARDATAITPPPFLIGAHASYPAGGFTHNLTVEPPSRIYDKSGRIVDAFGFRYTPEAIGYVSLRTMTKEATFGCGLRQGGECTFDKFVWWDQGTSGALGATLLQGRTFSIGDSWLIEGECNDCARPIRVVIEPPAVTSPPGTAYVAFIDAAYTVPGLDFTYFAGRIHMGTSHAFPLRADFSSGCVYANCTWDLTSYMPGTAPIVPPTPPEPAHYTPTVAPVPFEDGRPVEGGPLDGWPSWAQARAATRPDAADLTPNATFVSFSQRAPEPGWVGLSPAAQVTTTTNAFLKSRFARPNDSDIVADYSYSGLTPADHDTGIGLWSLTSSTASALPIGTCQDVGMPIWDAARQAMSLGFLTNNTKVEVRRDLAPGQPLCTRNLLYVFGDRYPPDVPFSPYEDVAFYFETGYLYEAFYIHRS